MVAPEVAYEPPRYQAPWWLGRGAFGAHLQTVYPALFGRPPVVSYTRERWDTTPHGKPDGDFIDVDRVAGAVDQPMLVIFHGLEGSSESPYALSLMAEAQRRGWRGLVAHFRGCGGSMNLLPRAYHSGDATEIDWILRRARAESPQAPLYVAAVSLGGNATLKWLGEQNAAATSIATAAAAVSAPVDLAAAGNALEKGFCKVYTRNFLATMKQNALAKLERFPDLFSHQAVLAARTLRQFDNLVTAPLHGFRDTDDYWSRASSKPGLTEIRVPTLMLNAANDPFLPAWALPSASQVSGTVRRDFPEQGGHVGFLSAPFPGSGRYLPDRVFHFFLTGN